ncbi:uncharacterized protein LOC132168959 [Corylus avellana]|uniref:uncharacterized protein LOC132168959 n=1 Tax=Corylus avellana TaxID=13451 RepID=UPI001E234E24|nr:uncharacterized protein LOC132168959 [Corylus avellana]
MAASAASEVSESPVLSLLNKRIRNLRQKFNCISRMEEAIAQGKLINEQEEVLRSKPAVTVLIDELEKLRQPLSQVVSEELSLAAQKHQLSSDSAPANNHPQTPEDNNHDERNNDRPDLGAAEDLLNLLYFGSLFDIKPQSDFTATMLARTHERGCCRTYDCVTDYATTDLLGERDLDLILTLGGLLILLPVDSSLSHKNALQRCIEHAELWLANADRPIEPNSNVTCKYSNVTCLHEGEDREERKLREMEGNRERRKTKRKKLKANTIILHQVHPAHFIKGTYTDTLQCLGNPHHLCQTPP